MSGPIFVDLNGNTARIDPQGSKTAHIKLTICAEHVYDEAGYLTVHGNVSEVWITADQADALADALKQGRFS